MRLARPGGLAVIMLCLTVWPANAVGAALSVAPTRIDMAPNAHSGSVILDNTGNSETTVQVETFAWNRGNSIEELEPTRGLLAVPAVFSLGPGDRQVIRVAKRAETPANIETAYRLVITEVPIASEETPSGVRFALRLSLPVFVTPAGAIAEPQWAIDRRGNDVVLGVQNDGNAHLYVRKLSVHRSENGDPIFELEQPAYVLAGADHAWPLPLSESTTALIIEAETNIGDLVIELGD